jgi:atypical dual specificity phosphatase
MIMLVGLPGSGKTFFSDMLTTRNADKFVHVNQDKLKTRQMCETLCRESLRNLRCPIIDRCNFDTKQRDHFLTIAREANVPVDVLVFSYSVDECIQRCEQRQGHPTVKPANAREVIRMLASQYRPPNKNFSGFRRIIHISSFEDANRAAAEYLNSQG